MSTYKLLIIKRGYGVIHEGEGEFISVLIANTSEKAQEILDKAWEASTEKKAVEHDMELDWERRFE